MRRGRLIRVIEALETRALLAAVAWDGGAGTLDWADAANWSGDALPTAADDVTIDVAGVDATINVTSGSQACSSLTSNESLAVDNNATLSVGGATSVVHGSLAVGSGTLSTASASTVLSVDAGLNWSGGTIGGLGKLSLGAGSATTITGTTSKFLAARLDNGGSLAYSGTGLRFGSSSPGNSTSAVLTNLAGGTFAIDGGGSFDAQTSSTLHAFSNLGTFRKTDAGVTTFTGVTVNNSGDVQFTAGGLRFLRGGVSSGAISVPAGSTLTLGGTYTVSAAISGAGTLAIAAGTVSLSNASAQVGIPVTVGTGATLSVTAASASLARVTLAGGTLGGTGALTISDTLDATAGGSLTGTGQLVIAAGAAFNVGAVNVSIGRPVLNHGTVNWTAEGDLAFTITGTLTSDGTIDVASIPTTPGAVAAMTGGSTAVTFENDGVFNQRGAGAVQIGVNWANKGTMTVDANRVLFVSQSGKNYSTIGVAGAMQLSGGTLTLMPDSHLQGTGSVAFAGGNTTLDASTYSVSGTTTFSGATVDANVTLTKVDPNLRGNLAFHQPVSLQGASVASGATVKFLAAPTIGGTFTIAGSVTFDPGAGVAQSYDTLVVTGALTFVSDVPATINHLTLNKISLPTTLTTPAGGVQIGASLLTLQANIAGTGGITILPGATWTTTPTTQSANAQVSLAAPLDNQGTINWPGGTAVQLNNTTITNDGTMTVTPTIAAAGATLSRLNAATAASLVNHGTLDVAGDATFAIYLATLANDGTVNIGGTATLQPAALSNLAAGHIVVNAGTTLQFVADATLSPGSTISGAGDVDFNAGTVVADATELTTTGHLFFRSDAATVRLGRDVVTDETRLRGSLTFDGDFTSTANLVVNADVTFNGHATFLGTIGFYDRITAAGNRSIATVTFGLPQTISLPSLVDNASFAGNAQINTTSSLTIGMSTTGPGIVIGPGITLRASSASNLILGNAIVAGTILNEGTMSPATSGATYRSAYLTMIGGTLINRGSLRMDRLADKVNIELPKDGTVGGGSVVNEGTITVAQESCVLEIAVPFTNRGAMTLGGRFTYVSLLGSLEQDGTIVLNDSAGTAGSLAVYGDGSYASDSSISGVGTFGINGGHHVFAAGSITPASFIIGSTAATTPAPEVEFGNAMTLANLTLTKGTVRFDHGATFTGANTVFASGTLVSEDAAAPLTIAAGSSANITGTFEVESDLVNRGTLTLAPGSTVLLGDAQLANVGILQLNATSGTQPVAVGISGGLTIAPRRAVVNTGTINFNAAIDAYVYVPFVNVDGTVNLTVGNLHLAINDKQLAGTWSIAGNVWFTTPISSVAGNVTLTVGYDAHGAFSQLAENTGTLALRGTGTTILTPSHGTFVNAGLLDLGLGTNLIVSGNFQMEGGGTLRAAYLQPSMRSRMTVAGAVNLTPTTPTGRSRFEWTVLGDTSGLTAGTYFSVITSSVGSTVHGTFDQFAASFPAGVPAVPLLLTVSSTGVGVTPTTADARPPVPVALAATYEDELRQSVDLQFNLDVSTALTGHDLVLRDRVTGATVALPANALHVDADGQHAVIDVTNRLPDGRYDLHIAGADVMNAAGDAMAQDIDVTFDILAGDVTRDGIVNFNDLLTLAKHYGTTSGAGLSAGNVDYSADGAVTFADLLVLARSYGHALMPVPAMAVPVAAAPARGTRKTATVASAVVG